MLPVGADFLAALRGSHKPVIRARLITPGATGADPLGVDLAVQGGTVTLDGRADIRGALDLTLAEPWPTTASTSSLTPYGTEVAISRGVEFGNGRIIRAPLGIYRLEVTGQDLVANGPLRVTGLDRMAGIVDARLLAPIAYPAATTLGAIMSALVLDVYPGATISWDDATNTEAVGRAVVAEEDRFGFLNELVTSQGKIWYWDYRGILVIKSPPNPTVSVFDVDAGRRGVLTSASRELSRAGVTNAVVATGEAADGTPPVRGTAFDTDPESLTYYGGPFGKVPQFFSSPLLTTAAKATAAAGTILTRSTGLPYVVRFGAVPNPALEPYDAVTLVYPPTSPRTVGQRELHVLDQVTIPLAIGGAMTADTRLRTTEGIFT